MELLSTYKPLKLADLKTQEQEQRCRKVSIKMIALCSRAVISEWNDEANV